MTLTGGPNRRKKDFIPWPVRGAGSKGKQEFSTRTIRRDQVPRTRVGSKGIGYLDSREGGEEYLLKKVGPLA